MSSICIANSVLSFATLPNRTMDFYSFWLILLLCYGGWFVRPVDSTTTTTHLRRTSQTEQQEEANDQSHDDHQDKEQLLLRDTTTTHARRKLQLTKHRNAGKPLALIATTNLHFNVNNERQRRDVAKCVRKRRDKILNLLNNGFQEVLGRVNFIIGTMELNNHACGSNRRLAVNDEEWLQGIIDDLAKEEEEYGDGYLSKGGDNNNNNNNNNVARDLQFRNFNYDYLFRGGATCLFCYPESQDSSHEEGVESMEEFLLQERLRILTAELDAHLTSVMQLSGIKCLKRRSPRVSVTLEPTSPAAAKGAECE